MSSKFYFTAIWPTLALWITSASFLLAQAPPSHLPPYTFGISAGTSYQSSDVRIDQGGLGLSAWLGRVYSTSEAGVGFGLRGRLSYSKSLGLDPFPTTAISQNEALNGVRALDYTNYPDELGVDPGFVYFNHRTDLIELAGEAVFTLNRLRTRNGLHVAVYGGYGLDWYQVRYDQASDGTQPYYNQYAELDPNAPKSQILQALDRQILDGEYETLADGFEDGLGKLKFMPSVGIELGFNLTPNLTLIGGHRTTFSGTDLLEGQQWEVPNNDILHYTTLGLEWRIPARPRGKRPHIQVIAPNTTPWQSPWPDATIRARIRHVTDPTDIGCTLNGRPLPFEFFGEQFTCRTPLLPGRNEVVISAANDYGTDRAVVVILYEPSVGPSAPPAAYRPEIRFIQPPHDGFETYEETFTLQADVLQVADRRDIQVWHNNHPTDDFTFSAGRLSAKVRLREGRNTFRIRASNPIGAAEVTRSVQYIVVWQKPEVHITKPSAVTHYTTHNSAIIKATVKHVRDRTNLRLTVNGRNWPQFSFDGQMVYAEIDLAPGSNLVRLIATNERGEAYDERTIIKQDTPTMPAQGPRITFIQPAQPHTTHDQPQYLLIAEIAHVRSPQNIKLRINGQRIDQFVWDGHTLRKRIDLVNGENHIWIRATNDEGAEEAEVRITYTNPVQLSLKPKVQILAPIDGAIVHEPRIELKAQLRHVASDQDVELWLDGKAIPFAFDTSSGKLSATLSLRRGTQTIRLIGRNPQGSADASIHITYQPIPTPTVQIIEPQGEEFSTTSSQIQVRARISGVAKKDQIEVLVNGRSHRSFQWQATTGDVRFTLPLKQTFTRIHIEARNEAGMAADEVAIRYKPSTPPSVQIEAPSDGTITKATSIQVRAHIKGVAQKQQVKVIVNNKPVSFQFSPMDGSCVAVVPLREGDNTVRIEAHNEAGKASDVVQVMGQVSHAPQVQITFPQQDHYRIGKDRLTAKAQLKYVKESRQIEVYLNNKPISQFQYDAKKGLLRIPIQLREGDNLLRIRARTQGGEASDEVVVTYKAPRPPQIEIKEPAEGTRVAQSTIKLIAQIQHVSSKKALTLTLNDKPIPNFTWDSRSGTLRATLQLREGTNTIVLQARNADGQASKQVQVYYKQSQPKPVVTFVLPARNGLRTDKPQIDIRATIKHVSGPKQVQLSLNGNKLTQFQWDSRTQALMATLVLKEGENLVKVTAINEAGSHSQSRTIIYTPRAKTPSVAKPTITIESVSQPVTNPMTPNSARSTLIATIKGVSDKKQIQLLVNNKPTSFSFHPKGGKLQATFNLKRGQNTIVLRATNNGGTVEKVHRLQF